MARYEITLEWSTFPRTFNRDRLLSLPPFFINPLSIQKFLEKIPLEKRKENLPILALWIIKKKKESKSSFHVLLLILEKKNGLNGILPKNAA